MSNIVKASFLIAILSTLLFLGTMALVSCDVTTPEMLSPDEQLINTEDSDFTLILSKVGGERVYRFVDPKEPVMCWILLGNRSGGISCIPLKELE